MTEIIIKICLAISAVIFIITLIIKRFVYFHPNKDFQQSSEMYMDVNIGPLHGWYIKGTNDKAILFCHGNGGNISHRQNKISAFKSLGYNVMIFDYSGYGKSKGIPKEESCYRDGCLFADKLLEKYSKDNIIPYGESLGAAVAMYITRRYNFPCVILESPLPSIKRIIKHKYWYIGFLAFLFPEFDTEYYMKGYTGRCMVLHSKDDKIIPYETTQILRDNARFVVTIQGSHNDPQIDWVIVDKFIKNEFKYNEEK